MDVRLADEAVKLELTDSISRETVRQVPSSRLSAEFVACMEDAGFYAEPFVVCFDETSKQLVSEKRAPIPAKAGRQERFDYEYQRNGTRNLFIGSHWRVWRHSDWASYHGRLQTLVGGCRLPEVEKVRVVLDNLEDPPPCTRPSSQRRPE